MADMASTKPDTIVMVHGFWVTPRSWEHWKEHYEAKGFKVLTPGYPGFEVEVEALREDPTPIEQLEVPEIIDMLENMIGKLDRPPIIIGPLRGRRLHSDPARSWVRRGRRGDQLCPDRRRQGGTAFGNQVRLADPEEPGQPASSGWVHAGTMALRVREHVQRGRIASALRALPHPRFRQGLLGKCSGEHPPRQGRQLRRLPQRRAAAAAVHLREAGSPLPTEGRAFEPQALQVGDPDRDRRVRWSALPAGG